MIRKVLGEGFGDRSPEEIEREYFQDRTPFGGWGAREEARRESENRKELLITTDHHTLTFIMSPYPKSHRDNFQKQIDLLELAKSKGYTHVVLEDEDTEETIDKAQIDELIEELKHSKSERAIYKDKRK
jgi:hypothetical protein